MPQFTEYLPLAQLTITNRFPQTVMFSNTVFMETSRSSFPVTSPTFHHGARVGMEECDLCEDGPARELPSQGEMVECGCGTTELGWTG